jgi:hypothetical protein
VKILAIEKEMTGSKPSKMLLKKEALKVYELMKKNIIREIYFDKKNHGAILIMELINTASARKVLKTMPLVKAKLIDFEIHELVPYDGLDRLIKS